MTELQIILTVCGAVFTAFNYTVNIAVYKRKSLPLSAVVLACILLPLIAYIIFGKSLDSAYPTLMSVLKWVYIGLGLLYSLSFAVFSIYIMSVRETDVKPDIYIVLGCKTHGYTPSKSLLSRIEKTYELLIKNKDVPAVLSGGCGKDGVTEAESMRAYLCDKGIPESRLITEDRSASTVENIEFSTALIKSLGLKCDKIAAVSSDYHIRRILKLARKQGVDLCAAPAKTPVGVHLYANLVREYMVWIKTALADLK